MMYKGFHIDKQRSEKDTFKRMYIANLFIMVKTSKKKLGKKILTYQY
jgi:hypothetical protein